MKLEQDIFDELATLCTSPGYVHAIAYLCFRDNLIHYQDEMRAEDMRHLFSPTRLIRTEISTLIGLSIKKDVDYVLPAPEVLQRYLDQTETLLEELHQAIGKDIFAGFDPNQIVETGLNPLSRGEALREPIFYSGEAAHSFQYRDLSPRKYGADDEWLKTNKGFTIQAARDVVHAVGKFRTKQMQDRVRALVGLPPDQWTLLPAFEFTVQDISALSATERSTTERVLAAFSLPEGQTNQAFCSLHDFNIANAMPLLRTRDGSFVLFEEYSLVEALYESPFYWMSSDSGYVNTAMIHRGRFTETFSTERLQLVFGDDCIHSNVSIYESKDKKSGEIDVLVLYGNRAIVLQAKSKRLTMEARRGNDRQIKEDFKKSVQDSYDQGYRCAQLLGDPKYKFIDADSRAVSIPKALKEVYILCVVSDSYPALNFQAQQLLRFERSKTIWPPLVMDVFTLDVMTEMLASPLHFLSYVNRRAGYYDRLLARDEMTILSYHLQRNLWIEEKYNDVVIDDAFAADLDVAMTVRRDGIPGKRTPDGILTRLTNTTLGRIVKHIEASGDLRTLDLGLVLLRLSEHAFLKISAGVDAIVTKARQDGQRHDITVPLDEAGAGVTVHCSDEPILAAVRGLRGHCEIRKYLQKAASWFGICLSPDDGSVRFGLNLDYEWQPNAEMDGITREFVGAKISANKIGPTKRKGKIGRNEPCPCGSDLKYKKCCGKRN